MRPACLSAINVYKISHVPMYRRHTATTNEVQAVQSKSYIILSEICAIQVLETSSFFTIEMYISTKYTNIKLYNTYYIY